MCSKPFRRTNNFLNLLQILIALFLSAAVALAFGATLEWDPNPEANVAGYRVYIGSHTREYNTVIDVGLATQKLLESLEPERSYYFAVTAYDSDGLESDFSDEVTYTKGGPTTATPLTHMTVFVGGVASFSTTAGGTGPFEFVWKKDGVVIDGASNAVFTIWDVSPGDAGTYNVEVSGACNTVTNTALLILATNNTNVFQVPLTITVSDGLSPVAISFFAEAGRQYVVQASADMRSWQTMHTVTLLTNGPNQWLDTEAPSHPMRFYRVLLSPP